MRMTSKQAYRQIKAEGLLGRMQFKVYRTLHKRGPMTGNELNHRLLCMSAHKRLSELKRLGVIEELCVRKDRYSGRSALVWRVVRDVVPKRSKR